MNYVISPKAQNSLPVVGETARFPVHQVYCVGRNYADHAIEMGHNPDREPPFFFLKPEYSVCGDGDIAYPNLSEDVHHEVEMVICLAKGGQDIPVGTAQEYIYGCGVGLDLTRRDLQAEAKEKSRPWESGKAFFQAAPCSAITPVGQAGDFENAEISLKVNGEIRQTGNTNQMIWKSAEIISRLSELFVLYPGDLIYTGTPAGVGPIQRGDDLQASVSGLATLSLKVV